MLEELDEAEELLELDEPEDELPTIVIVTVLLLTEQSL